MNDLDIDLHHARDLRAIVAFLGDGLDDLRQHVEKVQTASLGGKSLSEQLLARISILHEQVETLGLQVASLDLLGPASSNDAGKFAAIANRLLDEVVATRRDALRADYASGIGKRLASTWEQELDLTLRQDLDNALTYLQQAHRELEEAKTSVSELVASNHAATMQALDLSERIARGEQIFGTPVVQVARARRDLRSINGMATSIPFQLGYLLTSALRRPLRLPGVLWGLLRLVREAFARRRAFREGVTREPADTAGIVLPAEWHATLADARDRADIDDSELGSMAIALPESESARRQDMPDSVRTLRLAIIADEFTLSDLGYHCSLLAIGRQNWRRSIADFKPHILFVESAWNGNAGQWAGEVEKAGRDLQAVVAYCRSRGIQTVFWNKEDPVHFEHFLAAASLFDYVATTDLDRVPVYRERLRHDRIFLMPFAVNPHERNPIEVGVRRDACSFAGSHYAKYVRRNTAFKMICNVVRDYVPLQIYDRNYGNADPDLAFPEDLRPFIVGNLPYDSIDLAYKSYRHSITLNSVQNSQTMAARRVFDLLASNTFTISNYSRAIKLMLGDLLISTDDAMQLARRWEALHADPVRADKVRLCALRKVMEEHTVEHRLAYLLEVVTGSRYPVHEPDITVLGFATTQSEVEAIVSSYQRQNYLRKRLRIVLAPAFVPAARLAQEDIEVYSSEQASMDPLIALAAQGYVACFSPRDHYSTTYVSDLVSGLKYVREGGVGKGAWYRWRDGGLVAPVETAPRYRQLDALALRRALIPVHELAYGSLLELARDIGDGVHDQGCCTALDPFSYCHDGFGNDVHAVDGVTDVDVGLPLRSFLENARWVARGGRSEGEKATLDPYALTELFPRATHAHGKVVVTHDSGVSIESQLPQGQWNYVYAVRSLNAHAVSSKGHFRFALSARGKVSARIVVLFNGADDQRLGSIQLPVNVNHRVKVPHGCHAIRLAVRLSGSGSLHITNLMIGTARPIPTRSVLMTRSPRLLIGKGYPSRNRLYHYSFIHRRVLAYRDAGLRHAVFRWDSSGLSFDEFEGIDVIAGAAEHLAALLQRNRFASLEIHPLYPEMWNVIRGHLSRTAINIWVHGTEIQPWYRRPYNYPAGHLRDRAVQATAARLAMWRELFALRHPNLHFVFVSRYLAAQAMADVGAHLEPHQYSVIHNYIDENVFDYRQKNAEQRKRILSIRPYSSPVYANDLSVKAVLALSDEPFFSELQFLFVGDGELFDRTLEPLRGFANIEIRRGFLAQAEISALHKEFGLFLVPTRMDSQGVSRDEAMASGLVPLTNAVAAVPEFVDDSVGVLARAENWQELADGIRSMYHDPALFLRRSAAAAERVRAQSGYHGTIAREIALIRHGSSADAAHSLAPMRTRRRFALYGDLNLNITDGSAIWAVSLAQVLAGLRDTEVTVFLKAPITTLHIIEPLLSLENVRLIEPAAEDGPVLSADAALDSIVAHHNIRPFDAVVLRGFDLCTAATGYPDFEGKLWVYITDLPQNEEDMDDESRERISAIVRHARYVLCQTPQFQSHLETCFPESVGRTAILPPMIPCLPETITEPNAGGNQIVYAGKFAPLWGIREMLDVFQRLRNAQPNLELHVYGDKIHNVPDDPEFRPEIEYRLANTSGVVWHRQVSRDQLMAELPKYDVGWAWRRAELEEGTHELSTKVLEYAACGLPTVLFANEVNRGVLGGDYPLYAANADDAERVLAAALQQPARLVELRKGLAEVAGRYAFDAVRRDFVEPLCTAVKTGVPISEDEADESE